MPTSLFVSISNIAMAIYHLSVKVISRAHGSSALASAAYRCGGRLHDARLGRDHDFTSKENVVHSVVMLPEGANEVWSDRERLWNDVEAFEKRKDAQLCREVEFAIPRELDQAEGIRLAQAFVEKEFVARGMVADLNIHWDRGMDGEAKPHAHVMLTMREVKDGGFGAKVRDWNATAMVEKWRESWADHVNQRLAELDIHARVDHRSLEAQGIELEPQHKIGSAAHRMEENGATSDRAQEHRDIARENGDKIIAHPEIALEAMTRHQATFTLQEITLFAHRHSDGVEQFNQVWKAIKDCPDLVVLGLDDRGNQRATSRVMLEAEERLHRAVETMAGKKGHGINDAHRDAAFERARKRGLSLKYEQSSAINHLTGASDLGCVVGYAGTGKSSILSVAREAWEESGYQVHGLALSGIAAENLQTGSGIRSQTIASLEHQWANNRGHLTQKDILVIDEAGMVGTRQMERVVAAAKSAGAKLVLVGDAEQLQAIDAGAAFRSVTERVPHAVVTEIHRQKSDWQREATQDLAQGRTAKAIDSYTRGQMAHAAETRLGAREELIERWEKERQKDPYESRIILTHTNVERHLLNGLAREKMQAAGELGPDVTVTVEDGNRSFATGDRVMILKNNRELGVKNGMLGTLAEVSTTHLTIKLDNQRRISFDLKDFNHLDHGYAATIHKAQGVTVDRSHVLATPGLDRHATYVALSRHRTEVSLHYGQDDFAAPADLNASLSRNRAKDMASDYAKEFRQTRGYDLDKYDAWCARRREERERRARDEREAAEKRVAQDREAVSRQHVPPASPHETAERDGRSSGAMGDERQEPTRVAPLNDQSQSVIIDQATNHNPAQSGALRQTDKHRDTGISPSISSPDQAGSDSSNKKKGLEREVATPIKLDRPPRILIERHARIFDDCIASTIDNAELSSRQKAALRAARDALKRFSPDAWRDLEASYGQDLYLRRDIIRGRQQRVFNTMQLEAEIRTNPTLRAERFISQWNKLKDTHEQCKQNYDHRGQECAKSGMEDMARQLERDPQIESILRNKKIELGLSAERSSGGGISFELIEYLERDRGRGLSR